MIGRDEHLPLWLTGNGIGPKGMLSYDVLDIGDVFINSRHRYELVITNKGDIPAAWRLRQPTTPFGPKFTFEPTSGQLAVSATQIAACADLTVTVTVTNTGAVDSDEVGACGCVRVCGACTQLVRATYVVLCN